MKNKYLAFCGICSTFVSPLANLWARIYVGLIFWRSGVLKFEDMESTVESFDPAEDGEFLISFLPDAIPPAIPAYLATAGELILPVLLFLGLFTRVGAAGLLVMTVVIQFFVPGFESSQHFLWMIVLLLLVGHGGNKLSVDYWLFKDR